MTIGHKCFSPPEQTRDVLVGEPGFPPGVDYYCRDKSPTSQIMTREEAEEYIKNGGKRACNKHGRGCGSVLGNRFGYTSTLATASWAKLYPRIWLTNRGWAHPGPAGRGKWFSCVRRKAGIRSFEST